MSTDLLNRTTVDQSAMTRLFAELDEIIGVEDSKPNAGSELRKLAAIGPVDPQQIKDKVNSANDGKDALREMISRPRRFWPQRGRRYPSP